MEIIKDTLPMDIKIINAAEAKAARNHGLPVFKGRLFAHEGPMDQNLDEFGNPIFDFVNENTVVIGGAITALQHIFGVKATWIPATVNAIHGINDQQFNEFDCRVKLFGVGLGGCGMEFGPINDPDFKQREIIDWIPMRVSDTDTLELAEDVASKYYFRRPISTAADNPQFGWFLKEFEKPVEITSLWKDTVDPTEDGTEIVSEIYDSTSTNLIETFAECVLKITSADIKPYFHWAGTPELARYNSIGLFSGVKKENITSGYNDYVGVRLFSVVNIDNVSVKLPTETTYLYRIYAAV